MILVVQQGPDAGWRFALDKSEFVIGRAPDCDVALHDERASRYHVRLQRRDGVWVIHDMGSTNGTAVNGRRLVQPQQLRAGDQVVIGRTVFELWDQAPSGVSYEGLHPQTAVHASRTARLADEPMPAMRPQLAAAPRPRTGTRVAIALLGSATALGALLLLLGAFLSWANVPLSGDETGTGALIVSGLSTATGRITLTLGALSILAALIGLLLRALSLLLSSESGAAHLLRSALRWGPLVHLFSGGIGLLVLLLGLGSFFLSETRNTFLGVDLNALLQQSGGATATTLNLDSGLFLTGAALLLLAGGSLARLAVSVFLERSPGQPG